MSAGAGQAGLEETGPIDEVFVRDPKDAADFEFGSHGASLWRFLCFVAGYNKLGHSTAPLPPQPSAFLDYSLTTKGANVCTPIYQTV
jgi:hypothetical protein